jgi:chitodextrinase
MSVTKQSLARVLAGSVLFLAASCRDSTSPGVVALNSPDALAAKGGGKGSPPPTASDLTPPSVPTFSVLELGPTHAKVGWSSTDVSNPILYYITRNGTNVFYGFETSNTFAALQPSTTYTFAGKARDMAGNWSVMSGPFTFTTPAPDPNDKTAPTAPTNVWADGYGDLEFQVMWSASSDNVTPSYALIYEISVNGVVENHAAGKTWSNGYGIAGDNVITVVAIDAAGNRSAAGSVNLRLPF